LHSARVICILEMNRERCGDGAELSYVGYARVNSSVMQSNVSNPILKFFWGEKRENKFLKLSKFSDDRSIATSKIRR